MKFDTDNLLEKKDYYLSLQFLKNNIKKVILVVLIIFLLISISFFMKERDKNEVENKLLMEEKDIKENSLTDNEFIIIDVGGGVNNPGVYELESNARVEDAIKAAGGLKEEADLSRINRAEPIKDGQKIYILSKGEESVDKGDKARTFIDLNTATSEELRTVSGIGPATAERIILYRGENGNFQSVEDLKKVEGIGEKNFEKIKRFLKV